MTSGTVTKRMSKSCRRMNSLSISTRTGCCAVDVKRGDFYQFHPSSLGGGVCGDLDDMISRFFASIVASCYVFARAVGHASSIRASFLNVSG